MANQSKCPYEVLGVKKTATAEEIKKAYKKISFKCHPDMNKDKSEEERKKLQEKFIEANEAYSVLGDEEKRKKYDTYGNAAFEGFQYTHQNPTDFFEQIFGSNPFGSGFGEKSFFTDIGDFMNFGSSFSRAGNSNFGRTTTFTSRGSNLNDFFGNGRGNKSNFRTMHDEAHKANNSQANPVQKIEFPVSIDDFFTGCTKKAKINRTRGGVKSSKIVEFVVKPGAQIGESFLFPKEGSQTPNGAYEDVKIVLTMKPTPFKRNGDDLELEIALDANEYFNNVRRQIVLPGNRKIEIHPRDFKNIGSFNVLKCKGMPSSKTGLCGDLQIRITVDFSKITDQGLTQIAKICSQNRK